ncbi:MAG TPA: hypothetical protein VL096_09475, partial [Pirellulaceae bacterium]|nr:hypothetical protein [Pirellulaceae bacterium]
AWFGLLFGTAAAALSMMILLAGMEITLGDSNSASYVNRQRFYQHSAGIVSSRMLFFAMTFGTMLGMLQGLLVGLWPRHPLLLLTIANLATVLLTQFGQFLLFLTALGPMQDSNWILWVVIFTGLAVAGILHACACFCLQAYERRCLQLWSGISTTPASNVVATLVTSAWMRREFEVVTSEGTYRVAYEGRTMGKEWVTINGVQQQPRRSYIAIVPHHEFMLGSRRAEIVVTGWPWMALRSLVLAVEGVAIYREDH